MNNKQLFNRAAAALEHAYAPYSKFRVGAAVLTKSGEVYEGANMENASYGASICAERVALTRALYDGHRTFEAIAVAVPPETKEPAWPCGICRQFIYEFGDHIRIIAGKDEEHLEEYSISQLLPNGFRL
jgi:cytidine deaminase